VFSGEVHVISRRHLESRVRVYLVLAVCFLDLLIAIRPAFAFVRARTLSGEALHWRVPRITLVLAASSLPEGLSITTVEGDLRRAAAAWSREQIGCTSISVDVSIDKDAPVRAVRDGRNLVVFQGSGWGTRSARVKHGQYNPLELAETSLYEGKGSLAGVILEADVEINATRFDWSDGRERADDRPSLFTTLLHEIGHVLGLAHTCVDEPSFVLRDDRGGRVPICSARSQLSRQQKSLMYPEHRRPAGHGPQDLTSDERRAACVMYPAKQQASH